MYSAHLLSTFTIACLLVTLFSNAVCEPLRQRRQNSRHVYTVDTLVVVDDGLYSWFKQWLMTTSNVPKVDTEAKLKEYVSLLIHQVNDRYSGIESLSYVIRFQLVSLLTNQNVVGNLSTGSARLDAGMALAAFMNWLKPIPRGTYDHAVLLTRYPLTGGIGGDAAKGRAYIGKLCDSNGYSVSIVQEDGAFQSAHYVAHELAHILGSDHDGDGKGGSKCKASDRYIMAPVRDGDENRLNKVNPWHFSNCSTASIDIIINSITTSSRSNCLSSTLTPMPEFTATANSAAGQIYPADVQCQMLQGPGSRPCLGAGFGNRSDICTKMFCSDGSESPSSGSKFYCSLNYAAEKTTCGNKQWCQLGKCVEAADAPEVSQVCPNGDSSTSINGLSCDTYVKRNNVACYDETIRKVLCCASCESVRRPSAECPYGDKVIGCHKQSCRGTTVSGKPYSASCCGTCAAPTPGNCTDVVSIDGVSCAARVTRNGRQDCYNSSVAASCCQTCSQFKTNVTECPYGDKITGCNKENCGRTAPSGELYSANCCATCRAATPSSCTDVARIDGVSCAARITQNGRQNCYNSSVTASCCQTCAQLHMEIAGCQYGDHITGNYCNITQDKQDACAEKRLDCCASCLQYSGATRGHWSGVVLSLVILCGRFVHIVQS